MIEGHFEKPKIGDYGLADYARMIANPTRISAYAEALRRVAAGSVVIDIGTGTGLFALMASRFGARRVYAIEPHSVIDVARDLALENNLLDKIVFIRGRSTDVILEERADVLVSDLRGSLPLFGDHIPAIIDARARLLKMDATVIPLQDSVWMSIVRDRTLHSDVVAPWRSSLKGLRLDSLSHLLAADRYRRTLSADQLALDPRCWAVLDYTTVSSPDVEGNAEWVVTRDCWACGLCLWFESLLSPGNNMSARPGLEPLPYAQLFCPFPEPFVMPSGSRIRVRIGAELQGSVYSWSWRVDLIDQAGSVNAIVTHDDSDS